MVTVVTAIALATAAHPGPNRKTHPARFQVDGWVTTCTRGSDGFAAECAATKKAAGYTLRLSVADGQFAQFVEHPGCQPASNRTFREDAPQVAAVRQERWISSVLDRLSREMVKRCPKLRRLDPKIYRHPPALNSAAKGDVR